MSIMVHKRGLIEIGAWSLVVLLLTAAGRANDGTAEVSDASNASSTSTVVPAAARPKIPPPRSWPQASSPIARGQVQDSSLAIDPAPASSSAVPPAQNSDRAPSAAAAQPAAGVSQNDVALSKTTARSTATSAASQLEEPGSDAVSPQAAPDIPQAATIAGASLPSAPGATQDPALSKPQDTELSKPVGKVAEPEKGQVDLMATQSKADGQVKPVGCATCGGFHNSGDGPMLHEAMGCADGSCIPGRKPCYPPADSCNTVVGAFIQNLYQCLCCPDPCYQPAWVPAANASFFADYARPRTVTRLRYDNLESMTRPDRNQFWIQGVVAPMRNERHGGSLISRARLQEFYVYQEAAECAWQLLHRVSLSADQPELRANPSRLQRPELRHQVAVVRL